MSRQTVLIVGGSSGLGYQAALALANAHRDWRLVITSPDAERARQAANSLAARSGNKNIDGMALELDSFAAIREFCERLASAGGPPLKAVLFNAGIQLTELGARNDDGIELIFAVNHLGHFLLANLLLGQLRAPARLVFVSSSTHDPEQRAGVTAPPYPGADELARPALLTGDQKARTKAAGQAYASSKLCNLLCAYELDRRLRQRGLSTAEAPITVNAFDPGLMPGTALARAYGPLFRFFWFRVLPPLARFIPGVNTPETSGRNLARLLDDPSLANTTGKYFAGRDPVPSSKESYDEAKALDLWETSERLTGLSAGESPVAGPAAQRATA